MTIHHIILTMQCDHKVTDNMWKVRCLGHTGTFNEWAIQDKRLQWNHSHFMINVLSVTIPSHNTHNVLNVTANMWKVTQKGHPR